MLTFSSRKGFNSQDFEPEGDRDVEAEEAEEYSGMMRRALEKHADEVRLTRNLMLSSG